MKGSVFERLKSLASSLARWIGAIGAVLPCLISPGAHADPAWPNRPLTIVVPYPAGGITDLLARTIADALSKSLGQPVIADNRVGAAGAIGVMRVAQSPADGYTMVIAGPPSMTILPAINPKVGYHPLESLVPVAYVAGLPTALVVNASVPAKTPAELLEHARAKPGSLVCGHLGNGSLGHLACLEFARKAGVAVVDVPYKGAPQMIIDLLADRVQFSFSVLPPVNDYLKNGQVRSLGLTAGRRSQGAPGMQTLREQGYVGLDVDAWNALYAPAGTPPAIIERLSAEVRRALESPELRARIDATGAVPRTMTSAQLGELTREQYTGWVRHIAETRFRLD